MWLAVWAPALSEERECAAAAAVSVAKAGIRDLAVACMGPVEAADWARERAGVVRATVAVVTEAVVVAVAVGAAWVEVAMVPVEPVGVVVVDEGMVAAEGLQVDLAGVEHLAASQVADTVMD